jgi:HD-GYP domain-containing protein (c-di-GMP phosphodiesterase class II)
VAPLHDVGKIGIPDAILTKPAALNDADWRVMRMHPVIGAQIVASITTLTWLAPAIRAEHERCDGHGYPDDLTRDGIPLSSRITFACDAYPR